jgi:N6-L-threonylcarbamoyladenine synthase
MNVLGIETSCDETSASIISNNKLISNIIYTQQIHKKYGGVVPELASQEHLNEIIDVVDAALKEADLKINQLDSIAVTYGPGLMGSLLVGVNFVKAMSICLKIPFLGVNHLEGHLFSNYIENKNVTFPNICLLVSGGHTQIWLIKDYSSFSLIGETTDDAAGEAFDKGARILGLNYPGGPEIDKISRNGDIKYVNFPRPKVKKSIYSFSFSGLKTSLLYYSQKLNKVQLKNNISNIAASYQEAILDCLFNALKNLTIDYPEVKDIYISGGVAANNRLREKSKSFESKYNKNIILPKLEYCTDNAAMIAMAGYQKIINGQKSPYDLAPSPNLKL